MNQTVDIPDDLLAPLNLLHQTVLRRADHVHTQYMVDRLAAEALSIKQGALTPEVSGPRDQPLTSHITRSGLLAYLLGLGVQHFNADDAIRHMVRHGRKLGRPATLGKLTPLTPELVEAKLARYPVDRKASDLTPVKNLARDLTKPVRKSK